MSSTQIINRYLIKEVMLTFFGVTTVLLLIFISGQLVGLYAKAASGGLQASSVFITLGLKSIGNLVVILPLSFYIAILLAFSRLYKDSEMVVLAACGIGPWSFLRGIMSIAIVFALLVGGLSLFLAPWAEQQSEIIIKKSQSQNDISLLAAGRFKELSRGEGVVYVQEFDQNNLKMHQVFLQHKYSDKTKVNDKKAHGKKDPKSNSNFSASNSIVSAESGYSKENEKNGDKYLILENGERYEGPMPDGKTMIIRFAHHGIRLQPEQQHNVDFRQQAVSSKMLWLIRTVPNSAELQKRISAILTCLILTIMAVPLSKTSPRHGRYAKLALALLIFIIYSKWLEVSRAWIIKQTISPYIGLWWVHVVALLLALSLYVRWGPVFRRFWFGRGR